MDYADEIVIRVPVLPDLGIVNDETDQQIVNFAGVMHVLAALGDDMVEQRAVFHTFLQTRESANAAAMRAALKDDIVHPASN